MRFNMALTIVGNDADIARYKEILKSRGINIKGTSNEIIYKDRPEGYRILSGQIMGCSYDKSYSTSAKAKADPDAKLYIRGIANARIIDRMDEIVEPAGGDFKFFMSAPMLMADHSYQCCSAIGQVISLMPEFDGLHFEAWIGDPSNGQLTDKQREVRSLVAQGILRTVSIGFIPKEIKAPTWDVEGNLQTPALIVRWEMLELSVVPIPCNAGSLFDMRSINEDISLNATEAPQEKTLTEIAKAIENETKADSTVVQTLIFDKKLFTIEQAKKWARDHDFIDSSVDETAESIRLRQKDPADFIDGSFRTIELTKGVNAVIGRLKDDIEMEKKLDELIEALKSLHTGIETLGVKIDKGMEINTSILGLVEAKAKPMDDEEGKPCDETDEEGCKPKKDADELETVKAEIAEIKSVLKLIIEKL
jgi:hypothetical protein